ncbi:MAG: DUF4097 family beta strand repeat-containing protein [Chloroflexia bacterium]
MTNNEDNTRTISTADFADKPRIMLEQATGDVNIEGWDRQEVEVSTDDDSGIQVEQEGSQIIIRSRFRRERERDRDEDRVPHRRHGRDFGDITLGLEGIAAEVERGVARSIRKLGRRIEAEIEIGRWTGGRDFTLKVPHKCDITLRSSTGDLDIREVQGALYLQTATGDIRLENIEGAAIVNSASGDIQVDMITGKLGVHSASGDVRIDQANLEELSAHTASGDIHLEMMSVPGKGFDIKTVSGDLSVELPRDARLTAQLSTFSGDLDCNMSHERVQRGPGRGREQTITINGGGPLAHFSSVSGDVSIHGSKRQSMVQPAGEPTMDLSRQSAPQASSDPSSEGSDDISEPEGYAARKQASLEILQAVERGELSAQDAVRRLSELEAS